jgi:hypothetical protein
MFQEKFPQGNVSGYSVADRSHYFGYDIPADLLSLGDSRLADCSLVSDLATSVD